MTDETGLVDYIRFYHSQAWLARLEGNHPVAQAYEKKARGAEHLLGTPTAIPDNLGRPVSEQEPLLAVT